MFQEFLNTILDISSKTGTFKEKTAKVIDYVETLDDSSIKDIVKQIGTIPECIKASSSEEKLFSKSSDIVLARCFSMLGLKSEAVTERGDSADILAESRYHKYSLVADAKCFRMSRTAKNQKDFKVTALSNWRGEKNEYAVLVSPYFQYPKEESQIYKAALDENVCLFSWEHLSILLERNIQETENLSLVAIWNISSMISRDSKNITGKNCFLSKIDAVVAKKAGINPSEFSDEMSKLKNILMFRACDEFQYCEKLLEKIKNYSYEKAITELIKEAKVEEKKNVIQSFISDLRGWNEQS